MQNFSLGLTQRAVLVALTCVAPSAAQAHWLEPFLEEEPASVSLAAETTESEVPQVEAPQTETEAPSEEESQGNQLSGSVGLETRTPVPSREGALPGDGTRTEGSTFGQPDEGDTLVGSSETGAAPSFLRRFHANYFGILDGPSLGSPSAYQPLPDGGDDLDRPLLIQNFATVAYDVNDRISIGGTAYWLLEPVLGRGFSMRDPFLRVSHNSIVSAGNFNLYGDARVHFGVSNFSRENDMLGGLQSFQAATYITGPFTFGLFTSVRYNIFGSQGFGNDLELYAAPNVNYQISESVGLTLLYEIWGQHVFGDDAFDFTYGGADIEPGVSWQILPSLWINPYLNIPIHNTVNWNTISFGMMLGLNAF